MFQFDIPNKTLFRSSSPLVRCAYCTNVALWSTSLPSLKKNLPIKKGSAIHLRFIFTGGFNASNYVDAPHSNFLSFEKFLANVGAFLGHPKLLAYISNIKKTVSYLSVHFEPHITSNLTLIKRPDSALSE